MQSINIQFGTYCGTEIVNEVFTLVKGYQNSAKGGFVTVDGSARFGQDKVRIRVAPDAFTVVGEVNDGVEIVAQVVVEETDEEIIERLRERFDVLTQMTCACLNGDIKAMIVTGPPGVGKSFGVEAELEKASLFDILGSRKVKSEVVKGSTSALGLYATLYKYSDPNCVLVFDDSDSIFFDDVCLNLLKGALDTGKKRKISWLSDSHMLKKEGIPDSFNFQGSVIFITNLSFANIQSKKLKDHLAALESRCHFVDLKINTTRDKMLRIKQIVADGMLDEFGFDKEGEAEVVEFVTGNVGKLREVSLRTVIKCAQLKKAFPDKWEAFARSSLMRH